MTEEEIKVFREKLIKHAEICVNRSKNCNTEEACKQGLILPFISLLGYDIFNPSEVNPEHSADFSDKYKNRVDFAILKNGDAVIAIEAKQSVEKSDRGQLKGYFNACKSIKLGILTDGLTYEFFADCDAPNIMDDEPFLCFNFKTIAEKGIDNEQTKAIMTFAKSEFDPDNVGAEAKKKLILSSIITFLEDNFEKPSDDFITYLLRHSEGFTQRITQKAIEENTEIIKNAFNRFIDKRILDRVGLADKKLVKVEEPQELASIVSDIITTDEEVKAYEYAKQRLAFLVDNDELFNGIEEIGYKDFKTTFCIYYKRINKGKIFNFVENDDGTISFYFPLLGDNEIKCSKGKYKSIDNSLLESYKKAFQAVK